jgi:hypothetical protein
MRGLAGPNRSSRKGQEDRCNHGHDGDDDRSVEEDQNRYGSDERNEYEERDQHDASADTMIFATMPALAGSRKLHCPSAGRTDRMANRQFISH